jgi:MFS family permease
LLGLAEAGLAPALFMYIALWLSEKHRAQAMSIFMMAIPISNFLSGMMSGPIIVHMNGVGNMAGWRWLYITEGIPTILLGCIVYFFLPNSPHQASFLSSQEKHYLIIQQRIQQKQYHASTHTEIAHHEEGDKDKSSFVMKTSKAELTATFMQVRNWWLSIAAFFIMLASAGMSGFLPKMFLEFGNMTIITSNLLAALPNFLGIFSLYFWSRHSDRTNERFYHTILGLAVAVLGLALCAAFSYIRNLPLFAISTIVFSVGFWAGETVFLTYAASSLKGSPTVAIALFNTVMTFGGWVGPTIMGVLRDKYEMHVPGLIMLTLAVLVSIGMTIAIHKIYEQQSKIEFVKMTDMTIDDEDE